MSKPLHKAIVTSNSNRHHFDIGEAVALVPRSKPNNRGSWRYRNSDGLEQWMPLSDLSAPPSKHAEVIKAWADGATVEYRKFTSANWTELSPVGVALAGWHDEYEYRVKPKPTPAVLAGLQVGSAAWAVMRVPGSESWCLAQTFLVIDDGSHIPSFKCPILDENIWLVLPSMRAYGASDYDDFGAYAFTDFDEAAAALREKSAS